MNSFLYGKHPTEDIINLEVSNSNVKLWRQNGTTEFVPYSHWLLSNEKYSDDFFPLSGENYFKYACKFPSLKTLWEYKRGYDKEKIYQVYDIKEAAMLTKGIGMYRTLEPKDISILGFDIEATSLTHGPEAKTLIISNTYRNGAKLERKIFCYDEYATDKEFFDAWSDWVQTKNPSIMLGHNIHNYDLPYLDYCARRAGTALRLGRENRPLEFNKFESKFRKDGSNFFSFKGINIYGREIVDTFFLAMKYDIGRRYPSYGLKPIIQHENLEVEGRQFYDASKIRDNYKVPSEWAKIKKYAEHDADDAITLFDLMIPAYFHLAKFIPMSLTSIINRASGSQLNSFLVRSYLQDGHSIPKPTESEPFEGGLPHGNPGVYENCFKVDVSSMYPSIIITENIYDSSKDPKGHLLKMTKLFTEERLKNKKLAKETGLRSFDELQNAQKIIINSLYGLMGTPGLNFNYPKGASQVTLTGRTALKNAIEIAQNMGFTIVNYDTDSIMVTGAPEKEKLLQETLNKGKLRWEDDGHYEKVLVVKTKNYYMKKGNKVILKGSALRATMKEQALREFLQSFIEALLNKTSTKEIYLKYVKEILNMKDITRWTSRANVTAAILSSNRTNEKKVRDALMGTEYTLGDKIHKYFDINDNIKLAEHWKQDHSVEVLLEKLYSTICIFETVIDIKQFPNYTLKRNKNEISQIKNSLVQSSNDTQLNTSNNSFIER